MDIICILHLYTWHYFWCLFLKRLILFDIIGITDRSASRYEKMFLNMLALSSGFTFIYVLVQLVGVSVFVDMDILISKHFYQNMIFYYIAVFIIFSFGGVCYLLFYVITRLKIVSLLMAVAVNLYMVYYLKIDNLYFGLTVIDTMSLGGSVQAVIWFSKGWEILR